MKLNEYNFKQAATKVVFFLIFLEVLDLVWEFLFPTNQIVFFSLHLFFFISLVVLLLIFVKGTNKTSKELSKSNEELNRIFDTLDVAIWSHDLKSDILLITPGIEKLYGYKLEDFHNDTLLWKKAIYSGDLDVLEERQASFQSGKPATSIYRIVKPDGDMRWIQDRGFPTLDDNGQVIYFSSVLFDITDRKESEDRYRSLVEMSPDIIAVIYNYKFHYINEAGSKAFGANVQDELIGMNVSHFANAEDIEIFERIIDEGNNSDGNEDRLSHELTITRLDGKLIHVEMSSMPILYDGSPAIQLVGRDITARKKSEKMIHNMAFYDSLTGVPNRNMFKQRLNELIKNPFNQNMAILFLDLDRFKIINDTKGHSTGDLLLKTVAKNLREVVQNQGEVFRQGGDEFIILLKDGRREEVKGVAAQILDVFSFPLNVNEQELFITPSIGISIYPEDGIDQESLIKHADTAMYLAKERGKNNFQFYYRDLDKVTARKMEIENGLRKAIELNQLTVVYQPKVILETGKVIGVEALLRWEHPILGMVSPAEFIPLAEETGLIVSIGKWVLKTACEQSKEWEEKGFGIIPVAVNISVRQIQENTFLQTIKGVLNEVRISPDRLELEITESIMQNLERSITILNQLKKLGITISMDDFGTGYSSLSNLRHLPLDNIKIDKAFVDDISHSIHHGSIVKAIIDMADNLNFTTIAEGIETEHQTNFLIENSCIVGQGYYYSKPLKADELELYILNQGVQA